MHTEGQPKSEEQVYLSGDSGEFIAVPRQENQGEIPAPFTGGIQGPSDHSLQ